MANDWFDPFGMRRITDAVSTTAARSLVGRPIEVDARGWSAVIAAVNEAAPSSSMGAMLSGQLGLWRRLDVELGDVVLGDNTLDRVWVVADEVRAIEALPQRIGARSMTVEAVAGRDATAAWISSLTPADAQVRIVGDELLARLPGLGRFGDVILDPWWDERTVGVSVERAKVAGRVVGVPERFRRRMGWELEWLPDGTTVDEVVIVDGGVTVRGSIERYSIEVDVARLMADLASRQTGAAIDVLLGGA